MSRSRLALVVLATLGVSLAVVAQEEPGDAKGGDMVVQAAEVSVVGAADAVPQRQSLEGRGERRGKGGKGWLELPGTNTRIKFSGSVKLDLACELYGGSRGSFKEEGIFQKAPNIALDGTPTSTQIGMDAKGSFGGVSTETITRFGLLRCKLSMGGSSGSPGSASAQLDDWLLVGQTGSLFNGGAGPSSVLGSPGDAGKDRSGGRRHRRPDGENHGSSDVGGGPEGASAGGPGGSGGPGSGKKGGAGEDGPGGGSDGPSGGGGGGGGRAGGGGGSNPQIRLMTPFPNGRFSIAVEDSAKCSGLNGPQWNAFNGVGRVDYRMGSGSYSLRGMVRRFKCADSSAIGYGGAFGASWRIGRDSLTLDCSGGVGMGSYIGGTAGANPQDAVQYQKAIGLWSAYGANIGYTHSWSRNVSTSLYAGGVVFMENESIKAIVNATASGGPGGKADDNMSDDALGVRAPGGGKGKGKGKGGGMGESKNRRYDEYNRMFYSVGINTRWRIDEIFSIGTEATYNYRQTFADDKGINKFGKQFQVGASLNIRLF